MYLLCRDVAAVIDTVEPEAPIILVGHSMGGAVAVRAAQLITNLYGLGVIDVVEGTAMDALASMQSFLRSRPSSFSTISQAIEWWLVLVNYLTFFFVKMDKWMLEFLFCPNMLICVMIIVRIHILSTKVNYTK